LRWRAGRAALPRTHTFSDATTGLLAQLLVYTYITLVCCCQVFLTRRRRASLVPGSPTRLLHAHTRFAIFGLPHALPPPAVRTRYRCTHHSYGSFTVLTGWLGSRGSVISHTYRYAVPCRCPILITSRGLPLWFCTYVCAPSPLRAAHFTFASHFRYVVARLLPHTHTPFVHFTFSVPPHVIPFVYIPFYVTHTHTILPRSHTHTFTALFTFWMPRHTFAVCVLHLHVAVPKF